MRIDWKSFGTLVVPGIALALSLAALPGAVVPNYSDGIARGELKDPINPVWIPIDPGHQSLAEFLEAHGLSHRAAKTRFREDCKLRNLNLAEAQHVRGRLWVALGTVDGSPQCPPPEPKSAARVAN